MKRIDITGQKYGMLTAIKEVEQTGTKRNYLCRCDCGSDEIVVRMESLRSGNTTSCGCIKSGNISKANTVDLTGRKFGMLKVLRKSESKVWDINSSFWECRCVCGNEIIMSTSNLKSRANPSCGCRGRKKNLTRRDSKVQMTKEEFLQNILTRREAEQMAGLSASAFQHHLRQENIVPCKVSGKGRGAVQLFWKEDVEYLIENYLD